MFGNAQNPVIINSNKLKFTVYNATQTGLIVIIIMPNTTNIDLREAAEVNSTSTFSSKFIDALKPFKALRFSSWSIGREADYNPNGLPKTITEWETRLQFFTNLKLLNIH